MDGVAVESPTTTALDEDLPNLVGGDGPRMLAYMLSELGRRGGVAVSAEPVAKVPSARSKKQLVLRERQA